MIGSYPSPAGGEEYAVTFDRGRSRRLLLLPALFDEGNKLRHFTIEVMRGIDRGGVDTFLPDLPGCNESLQALREQSLAGWRLAAEAAARHFEATDVLTIRGGVLCSPRGLRGVHYAPAAGASLLRGLIRARIIASKEAGLAETSEGLAEQGRRDGLELAGYRLGARMIAELAAAELPDDSAECSIAQSDLGGPALWLRAEPDHDPGQAAALTARVLAALA